MYSLPAGMNCVTVNYDMFSIFLKVWLISTLDRIIDADGVIGMGIAATAAGLVAGGIAAVVTASRKKWKIIPCKCNAMSFDYGTFPQEISCKSLMNPFLRYMCITLLETTCSRREVICTLPNSILMATLYVSNVSRQYGKELSMIND